MDKLDFQKIGMEFHVMLTHNFQLMIKLY